MKNRKLFCLILLFFVFLSGLSAQFNYGAGSGFEELPSTQFDMTGAPQWVKDLRRAEIIAFGAFPFTYLITNISYDSYRWSNNSWDVRYAPWPIKGAGAIEQGRSEKGRVIAIAAGGAVLLALIDYGIVRYKRSQKEKESRSIPAGTPIIIRKPLGEETAASSPAEINSREASGLDAETRILPVPESPNYDTRDDPDAANWDIETLDTARDADYLSAIEKDVILEMNKVRTNPKKYAELYLQPRLKYYNGKNYSVPGQITIVTQEGIAAVNSCITALNRAGSAGILIPEKGLSLAAKDHVADQSKTGQIGHNGSDKSTSETRMKRYGEFSGSWTYGENIAYGEKTGRDIVCGLLVDDGVPNRGHRTNIMNKAFTQTGVGFGTHTRYRTSCTITYANGYTSN